MGCAETKVATWDDLAFKLIILGWNVKHRILQNVDPWYRIFTKGRKTKPNRTKPSTDLKRARKTEAKGAKGLKTELKRTFPDRLDNVCAFNEVKTKSKSTPGYGFGKGIENRTRKPKLPKGTNRLERIGLPGYGVLDLVSFVVFGEVQAQIRRIFLDGYGVLVVRTVIFKYLRFAF
ncbi:hypothetical protein Tco_0730351 [Tanacetum coccineum]|uniref:Uncharacterized protein n=1 Tax=Tanacetum coccineum TaxID=301880 RepID=A0ABQ4YU11_9ASTR